jgi:galactoside O-acetyltransferase
MKRGVFMLSYKENEQRKADGKLFSDTVFGLADAAIKKTLAGRFNRSWGINIPKRFILEKLIFGHFGMSWMEPPFYVCTGRKTSIGDGCYFNFNTTFIDDYDITIEDNVLFGANVTVITTGHPVHPDLRAHGEMYCAPVTIKKGAWLCSNVTVLPGVTIGENAVIGAGSVVTKDIPANTVSFGSPCKVYRSIDENDRIYYYKDRKAEYGVIK